LEGDIVRGRDELGGGPAEGGVPVVEEVQEGELEANALGKG